MSKPTLRLAAAAFVVVWAAVASVGAQPRAERIADGVVRFTDIGVRATDLEPSVALVAPFPAIGAAPAEFPVQPIFFETDDNKEGFAIEIQPGTSLYGTGGAAGPLLRNGRVIDCWNTSPSGGGATAGIGQGRPWVLAVRADGSAFGVLADTTWRVRVDLVSAIEMISDGPDFAVIVIDRGSPQEVVQTLARLTGTIEMPPAWAIGYHQVCSAGFSGSRIAEAAERFRERGIPADALWMDMHSMDGSRDFSFDPEGFGSPRELPRRLGELGMQNVWMLNPGIKVEEQNPIYASGTRRNIWVKTPHHDRDYAGEVWPGDCVFPDYTNHIARDWWSGFVGGFVKLGIDGLWIDTNEPTVFNAESRTMPLDNIHRADEDLGGQGPHAKYHNIYGMQMARATREGLAAAFPDRRPFVLSTANFLGGQRFAATPVGETDPGGADTASAVPATLNLGLSGSAFAGPDIVGLAGDTGGETFARRMGVGAMLPFVRGHTGDAGPGGLPWSFGSEIEVSCRRALGRRYVLLPYLYTLFYEAHAGGMPIVRPLFFLDPADAGLRAEDDAFLLGGDLLVVPGFTAGGEDEPTLPADMDTAWRRLRLGDAEDPRLPGLYLRVGSIVPSGPELEYTSERALDPLVLLVALDAEGHARGTLYEDAGDGWDFRDGAYRLTTFEAFEEGGSVIVRPTTREGRWPAPARAVRVRLLLPDGRERVGEGAAGEDIIVKVD